MKLVYKFYKSSYTCKHERKSDSNHANIPFWLFKQSLQTCSMLDFLCQGLGLSFLMHAQKNSKFLWDTVVSYFSIGV